MLRGVTRIAFIGAGSIEFTRDLLGDLLTYDDLGDLHVALHDIDPERLETAEAMLAVLRSEGLAPRFSHEGGVWQVAGLAR